MGSMIKENNIYKSFGTEQNKTTVLDGVSLDIKQGEFVSLMGASGSGKSTLLYLLGGLDHPDSGTIEMNGRDISHLSDKEFSVLRRRNIGFVFQFYNLVQNLSVEDNIMLPLIMDGKKPRNYRDKLEEILTITGLTEKRRSMPNQLSGGQQQRTAVARAVISEPQIILADEPTGNLDSRSGTEIMQLFKKLNEKKNITILQVTHSKEMAEYGNKIIYLADGKIVEKQ